MVLDTRLKSESWRRELTKARIWLLQKVWKATRDSLMISLVRLEGGGYVGITDAGT